MGLLPKRQKLNWSGITPQKDGITPPKGVGLLPQKEWDYSSCKNVAPVNLCLGRATTGPIRHNGAKKKLQLKHKKKAKIIITDDPSPC